MKDTTPILKFIEALKNVQTKNSLVSKLESEIKRQFGISLSWTNNLKNNIDGTVLSDSIIIDIPDYGIVIDKGRRPGAKMPPKEPIEQWMNSVGIEVNPSSSFLIRRSIGRDGIKPKPYIDKTLDNIEKAFEKIIDDYLQEELNKLN